MPASLKAWAFFRRDFRNDISYRLSFIFEILNIVLTLASFYFLSKLLGERVSGRYAPFPFLLLGMAVNGYMTTALYCFSQSIRGNQQMGVLKAVLATPVSPLEFVWFSSLYPLFRAALDALVYLAGGVLLGLSLGQMNLVSALVLFVLSVLAFACIGILSATFTLLFKKGDPLLWAIGGLSWLLGGVFYPLEVLPPLLRQAAALLPITHSLTGMRMAILEGASLAMLAPQIAALGLFAAIGLPVSLLLFLSGMRWTRTSGSLGHF
ncbi:MAG: ABC transporter permease [Acidobacteria bacterium]|nr:ABC transporter permease [Acidobacteriota bacterium]